MIYPANLEPDDNGTLLVTFPDFPEATTFGVDEDEALMHAVDALLTVIGARIDDREDVPLPSAVVGGLRPVVLPALVSAKVRLWQAARTTGVGKSELARRLGCHLPQINRLFNLDHASRLDQIEAAYRALGKRLVIAVEDAA
jgi:antitoxin HicB